MPKKKLKIPLIIIGAIAVVIIIIIAVNWDNTDYIGTIKNHTPYYNAGITCSIGEVFNKYVDSPKWSSYKSDDTVYVNVKGEIIGLETDIETVFAVTKSNGDCYAELRSILIYGTGKYKGEDAEEFLYEMFDAYNSGYSTLLQYALS